jgi:copper chaperone CopZ
MESAGQCRNILTIAHAIQPGTTGGLPVHRSLPIFVRVDIANRSPNNPYPNRRMKRFAIPALLALLVFLPAIAKTLTTETIALPTIQCNMCKQTIESKLADLDGLQSITVDVENHNAVVVFNAEKVTLSEIETAITKVGYDANEKKAVLKAQKKLSPCCQPGGDR